MEAQRQKEMMLVWEAGSTQGRRLGAFSWELLMTLPAAPEAGDWDSVIYPDGSPWPHAWRRSFSSGSSSKGWLWGLALGGVDTGVHTEGVREGGYNRGPSLLGSQEGPRSWEVLVPSPK